MGLKLICLERLERGRSAAKRIVFGDAVKNMNAAVVEQRGLGNLTLRPRGAGRTALQRCLVNILDGLEAMAPGAFVFVQRHD